MLEHTRRFRAKRAGSRILDERAGELVKLAEELER